MAEEFSIQTLLSSREMTLRDIVCRGTCRHRSAEECVSTTHLVFPYRGTYVRHVGQDNAVADANQLMLFNHGEGYRVSHPISGGDASLSLALEGLPLYRYQLRCRLARALDLLHEYDDLSALALDLGFSTHSHFSAAFRQLYGRTPAEMQRALRPR